MIRIGTDIVEISRIAEMKNLTAFIKRAFTKREAEYFSAQKNLAESVAGAFAAKEAFAKYAGSGFRGFGFQDIEILHDELNKPHLFFMGKKLNADVSISHSNTDATAVVCGQELTFGKDRFEYWKSYRSLLPKRHDNMHKGDCGRVLVIAGSVGMVGAGCLCSNAAMRSGSGLVTLALPECIQMQAAIKLDEVMTYPLPCKDGSLAERAKTDIAEKLKSADVCAIGPGLGQSDGVIASLVTVLGGNTPCVIDADALNVISKNPDILKTKNCDTVITPHMGEMARLTGYSIDDIEKDRVGTALEFAKKYDTVVVLKGNKTVIASPNGEYHINTSGNCGMASGGMGDVLTGIIASFIGQGVELYNAALLGVFLHGVAGDMAAEIYGKFGLIAGDVLEQLPFAIKGLSEIE